MNALTDAAAAHRAALAAKARQEAAAARRDDAVIAAIREGNTAAEVARSLGVHRSRISAIVAATNKRNPNASR